MMMGQQLTVSLVIIHVELVMVQVLLLQTVAHVLQSL